MTTDPQASVLLHLVEEIHEQFLVCQVCRCPYSRPKNLPCLHTFCLRCIETTHDNEVSNRKYGDPREITCPVCYKKSQLPVGGARNLTDNFLILNLAELVDKQKSAANERPQLVCDICREENKTPTATPENKTTTATTATPEKNNKNKIESKPSKCQLKQKRKSFMSADLTILSEKHYKTGNHEVQCDGDDDDDDDAEDDDDDDDDDDGDSGMGNGEAEERSKNGVKCSGGRSVSEVGCAPSRVAVSKCLECNKMLCLDCIKKHQNMKVTSRHSMIDVETEKDVECKEHPGEPVRFYCDKCETCVCVLCAFNSHREHDVENFSDAASRNREPLRSLIHVCEERVKEYNDIFRDLSALERNLREVEEKIRETSSSLVMQVRQQERQLIDRIRMDVDVRIFDYIENKNDLKLQMDTLQNTCCLAKIVLDSNDVEMLLLKKEVEEKLTTLSLVGLKELPEGVLKERLMFSPGQASLGELLRAVNPSS